MDVSTPVSDAYISEFDGLHDGPMSLKMRRNGQVKSARGGWTDGQMVEEQEELVLTISSCSLFGGEIKRPPSHIYIYEEVSVYETKPARRHLSPNRH